MMFSLSIRSLIVKNLELIISMVGRFSVINANLDMSDLKVKKIVMNKMGGCWIVRKPRMKKLVGPVKKTSG